jgi:hypothetical protein
MRCNRASRRTSKLYVDTCPDNHPAYGASEASCGRTTTSPGLQGNLRPATTCHSPRYSREVAEQENSPTTAASRSDRRHCPCRHDVCYRNRHDHVQHHLHLCRPLPASWNKNRFRSRNRNQFCSWTRSCFCSWNRNRLCSWTRSRFCS